MSNEEKDGFEAAPVVNGWKKDPDKMVPTGKEIEEEKKE